MLGSDSQRATGGARRNDRQPTERRLAELAAEVGPLRRLLAAVAARLIETRAYERLCYARLSDYGRERAGVSARQLQDLARVHRALGGLPRLERALIANELPWSKVRLVARVATAQDEQAWIARAREVPTRRLEQEVRKRAGGTGAADLEASPPETRVSVRCTPAVCEKWAVAHEMAERVAGQRLRAGEALELVVAEIFSAVSIHPGFAVTADGPAGPRGGAGEPGVGEVTTGERGAARNLSPELASLAEGLDMADAFDLDRRLCLLVGREQTLDATMAPLLRRVSSPEYEWRGDYQTLGGYARNQLGMSASKARALLRIERAAGICPELIGAYRDGRLSWVKAQCLLPLLLLDLPGEWRPAWVAWAQQVTVRRLEQDVARALLLRAGHDRAWRRCKFHPERTQDPIPADERQMCAPDVDPEATQQLAWRVPRDVALLFVSVRETLRARVGGPVTEGELFGGMLDSALLAWTLREPGTRRPDPVIERDGYRCAVPGCTSRRNLQDHHVVFRSAGGSDAPENRITLCAFHHQRCLHVGRLRIRGEAPDGVLFELGLRGGARPLVRYRSGDVELSDVLAGPGIWQRRAA